MDPGTVPPGSASSELAGLLDSLEFSDLIRERPRLHGPVTTVEPGQDPEQIVAWLEKDIGSSGGAILDIADLGADQVSRLRRDIEAQPFGQRVQFWP